METKLSNTERQALARETAADKYGYRDDQWQQSRTVFHQGWDAALEWVGAQMSEGIAHLDNDEDLELRQRIQDGMDRCG